MLGIGHHTGIEHGSALGQRQLRGKVFLQHIDELLHIVSLRAHQGTRARGHHGVFDAGLYGGKSFAQTKARLHVADTFGGQRMAAQIRVVAVVVQACRLLQFLEHAHKALRIKTGLGMHIEAQAVGFAFHVT